MLDMMRRKKRLRAVLWLVILSLALGMLLFFVPGQNTGISGFDTYAASVDGDPISVKEFLNTYRRILDNFSARGRNALDPEILKKIGLDRQAIDALINVKVIKYTARRLGLSVAPDEVRRAVETHPNLQDRGAFIGVERYKALLAANNVPVSEFEESIGLGLLERKIRNVISDSMEVGEKEVRDEFLRANQEAQVNFVVLKKDDFSKKVKPSDADLKTYFEAHKDKYHIREQRRAQYLLFPLAALAPTISVTEQELKERWEQEPQEETVDASHILFSVKEPAQDAAVRAKAEAVLKRAKAGEDFAKLAKEFSEDPGSAQQGGNLGAFARGRMVKEFEETAFTLKPGEISGLVKTQFGYHIIKVLRHDIPNFESSRKSLERAVQMDRASELLKKKAAEAGQLAAKQKDLQEVGKEIKIPFEVRETGFLSKDSDPFPNNVSQPLLDEIFRLKNLGDVGNAVEHPSGQAIPKLMETKLPKPPEFTEARDRVEKDYIEIKTAELIQAEARRLVEEARKLGGLDKASAQAGLKVKASSKFKRNDSPDPEIGSMPAFNSAAFEGEIGSISEPITLDGGNRITVLQVKSRTGFDEAEYQKQKSQVRERLWTAWKDIYFQEYIRKVTEVLEKAGKIRINQRAIDDVIGHRS